MDSLRWDGLLRMIWGQLLYMSPWIALPALAIGLRALSAGPEGRFPSSVPTGAAAFFAYSAWPVIIVFTLVALWSDTQFHFHWQAPGYLMLFILMGCWAAEMLVARPRAIRIWLYAGFALTGLILTALLIHAATGAARQVVPGDWQDPTALQLPWTEVGEALDAQGAFASPETFIAGSNWIDCGYIDTQVSARAPVLCLGAEPRNLGYLFEASDYRGWNGYLVVAGRSAETALALNASRFETLAPVAEVFIHRADVAEFGPIQILYGEGFMPAD